MDDKDREIATLKAALEAMTEDRNRQQAYFNRAAAQRDELQQEVERMVLEKAGRATFTADKT